MSTRETASASSLSKGLDILSFLSARERVAMREMVEQLQIPRPTLQRLIRTLSVYGLVSREGRTYEVTDRFRRWGERYAQIADQYREVLDRLARDLQETFILAVVEGRQVRFIDHRESDHAVRVSPEALKPEALERTAVGRVYLSQAGKAADLSGRAALAVESARETGVGWNEGETNPDLLVMAVWADHPGPLTPILAVALPRYRGSREQVKNLLSAMVDTLPGAPPVQVSEALQFANLNS